MWVPRTFGLDPLDIGPTRQTNSVVVLAVPAKLLPPKFQTSRLPLALARGGNEPSRARLAAARPCNEPSSARLAYLTSSKKRLGSARSWLASRLAEPTSLGIKLNLLSKL
jgi:hypothetical protein